MEENSLGVKPTLDKTLFYFYILLLLYTYVAVSSGYPVIIGNQPQLLIITWYL